MRLAAGSTDALTEGRDDAGRRDDPAAALGPGRARAGGWRSRRRTGYVRGKRSPSRSAPGERPVLRAVRGDAAFARRWRSTSRRTRLAGSRPAAPTSAGWDMADAALANADGLVQLLARASDGSTVVARGRGRWLAANGGESGRRRGRNSTWPSACSGRTAMVMRRASRGDVLRTAEALGSLPLRSRAEELSRVARSRSTLEEPWYPLTAREFEVARLIADGMTNPEIASQLTLSPKTVSAHVEHILAKLGVARRSEIAAWVATVARAGAPNRPGVDSRPTGTQTPPRPARRSRESRRGGVREPTPQHVVHYAGEAHARIVRDWRWQTARRWSRT